MHLLLYPILPALVAGTIAWLIQKKKGYTSVNQLIIGIIVFYAIFYLLIKTLLN